MKCYQVIGSDIVSGLPVVYNEARPFVRIGNKKAFLSNALLETNPGARVLDCDVEMADGGEAVLIPSTGEKDTVLVTYVTPGSRAHVKSQMSGGFGAGGAMIIISSEISSYYPYLGTHYAEGVLARMQPGCELKLRKTSSVPKPKPTGWRGLFASQEYRQEAKDEAFLLMSKDGKVAFSPDKPAKGA